MKYRVVAFDLDGTLLNSQGEILPSSIEAIKAVREKGVKVVLVTGRHHTAVKPYYHQLQLDTPIICCNGTYIYDVASDSTPIANPFSWQQARKVIEVAEQLGIHLLMYTRDQMTFTEFNPHMRKFTEWVARCPEAVRPDLRQLSSFYEPLAAGEAIWKFVISHPERTLMESAVAQLPSDQFSCEWSWIDRVDVANNGNSKGGRLLDLLQSWNIDPQQVIAFGDNHNDISMLTAVGLGVAMGNAEEDVKSQAKLVTSDNDQNGIQQVLEKYI
ncbi:pyridoxal phosphatase [Testudinibacter sp. TR-2022]|uniref:pyridoxal phosphatase n=1 Tax=Testudinibacter sp. TR-2022 TaxID=2585029 RepID=UPI00111A5266|nr:pyridoxal phosphatase [Testudinibacter sp. TR-2022]TNH06771.1 pyridoxal phosphatase [Pasteurellaceae bacterium Phil11]TNH22512.1 pyridoxal phosphatase [Testudinibacter sp. TR-2022]TNH28272.1 pyridoxal phosphatase [Testudinibacter sp. TR-2022]